jgi:hypothetical protein
MALDLTLPADGVTPFGTLYKTLRDNFNALNDAIGSGTWQTVSSFGTGWTATQTVKYRKDPFGFVYLRGVLTAGAGAVMVMFTLPAGYFPLTATHNYLCGTNSSKAAKGLSIVGTGMNQGQVQAADTTSGMVYYFSDRTCFYAGV